MIRSIDEDARRRFEREWQTATTPRIEDFLPTVSDKAYSPTLEELVHIELELAWKRSGKAGGGPLVESYLERFPALKSAETALRLLRTEFEVRRQWGDSPALEEYRRRFPEWIVTGRELGPEKPAAGKPGSSPLADLPAVGHVLIETIPSADRKTSRYTLTRVHAEGGLGRIWIARDASLNREVALKEIKPEGTGQPEVARRFLKEAQIAGQLEHPNIVPVYELARRPDTDQPFYTMRLVRGETLRHAVAAYHERKREGRADALDLPRLLTAFVSICHAISFAHSKGVIHRDLKPENVVLGSFGEVLLLDWGLAKLVGEQPEEKPASVSVTESASLGATKAGHVLGTPAYMSPEQAAGRISKINERTDIYGLGAILFEILVGWPPHRASDMSELLNQVVLAPTPRASAAEPRTPPALSAICAKAMEREQEARYATAAALAEDVQRYLADEPVSVYPPPWVDRAARFLRKHRTWALSGAAALVLVAVVSSVAAVLINEQKSLVQQEKQKVEQEKKNVERAHGETKVALTKEAQARQATERELRKATAHRLAAQSLAMLDAQPQRALLLAAEAAEIARKTNQPELPYVRQTLLDELSLVGGRPLGPVIGKDDKPLELDLVAVSPDGKYVAAASAWRRNTEGATPSGSLAVYLWSLAGAANPEAFKLAGPTKEVASLVFGPGGNLLIAGSLDGGVYVWKIQEPLSPKPALVQGSPPPLPGLAPLDVRHERALRRTVFSPDGKWLAALYSSGQLQVWKVEHGVPAKEPWLSGTQLMAGNRPLIQFTADNKQLLTVEGQFRDCKLHVWNLTEKNADAKPAAFSLPPGNATSLALSSQGDQLAMGTSSGAAWVWPLTADGIKGEPLALRHPENTGLNYNEIESLAFSPDGRWLVTSAVSDCRLWNLAEAKAAPAKVRPHGIFPPGRRLVMDPKGVWFALAGDSASQAFGGQGIRLHDFPLLSATADSSPFMMHIAGSLVNVRGKEGGDEMRFVVAGSRSEELTPGITRLRGSSDFVLSMAGVPTGKTLVSGARDGTVRVWDVSRPDPFALPAVVPPQWGLAEGCLGPQGNGAWMISIASSNDDPRPVRLWNLAEAAPQPRRQLLEGMKRSSGTYSGVSPRGRWFAATAEGGGVLLWDVNKETSPLEPLSLSVPEGRLVHYRGPFRMSNDERWLVAMFVEKEQRVPSEVVTWDLTAKDIATSARTTSVPDGKLALLQLSPDSRRLVMGSQEGNLRLLDLVQPGGKDGSRDVPLEGEKVSTLSFTEKGERAFIGCRSGRIRVWDVAGGKFTGNLEGHQGAVYAVAVSPDGKLAASTAENEPPRLWKLDAGGATSVVLPLEEQGIEQLAFSPSSRWLVVAGANDLPAVVWDLQAEDVPHSSVRLFRRWLPGDMVAGYVRFTDDSRQLVTIGPTGARYWPLEMEDLVRLARETAGRELTAAERGEYLPGAP